MVFLLKGFDGRGNYTLGIKEQIAFPEISIDKVAKITGMDITFVTNTDSDSQALDCITSRKRLLKDNLTLLKEYRKNN